MKDSGTGQRAYMMARLRDETLEMLAMAPYNLARHGGSEAIEVSMRIDSATRERGVSSTTARAGQPRPPETLSRLLSVCCTHSLTRLQRVLPA